MWPNKSFNSRLSSKHIRDWECLYSKFKEPNEGLSLCGNPSDVDPDNVEMEEVGVITSIALTLQVIE